MTPAIYLSNVHKHFSSGAATEHTYRGDLQALLSQLLPGLLVTNEPKRQQCGAPDYIISRETKGRDALEVGYIEAKDIGEPLEGKKHKEQFDRYRAALANLIITDYLDFHFYREGERTVTVRIGEVKNGKVIPLPEYFDTFIQYIKDFALFQGQTVKSPEKLAKMMAAKARLLANVIQSALDSDELSSANNALYSQYEGFQKILIHDIDTKGFADIYAQTIAYGMFAARLHDPSLDDFSREEAAKLIPMSNPFLRKLFQYIAGNDLDDRIVWIVDSLVEIFLATNVAELMTQHGKQTQRHDPVIHFYETFLAEYDASLRKARGVWYTPEPVVNFIVRAVDDILKTEFDLSEGLADASKTTIKVDMPVVKGRGKERATRIEKVEKEVHRVQILDPACGTGTFLAEAVKHIYQDFESMPGIWPQYVKNDLVPRLHGFEILMASYAMAHLKMDLLLRETGYEAKDDQRFNIFLTNALEEHHPDTATLFTAWLSDEAQAANYIKRDTPVMVVIGNPPYSGHSANKGKWIEDLLADYKQEPGGGKLQEKNPKWLNDDYVKFIRYGQFFVEKNREGVLAYISNNGFLDNPTFRGMRWHLLTTFDKIYIIDLHGNSKKKETAPDGSKDENVFDIQQGVSINLFIKTGKKKKGQLAEVLHCDLYGSRESKYQELLNKNLEGFKLKKLALR
ncbi:N-6 DNA methylase [Thiothrix subterranea]|uniref:N-6 DNA methylase n=1 Tax=Thiothrix subterranea TaxID=2735563 RepID=UPI00192CA72A|nr:N-6 DNA methylase [Thiothrix subterranea]QQZ27955.1 N-6 DNA methylase [Thiothrix subterranea]